MRDAHASMRLGRPGNEAARHFPLAHVRWTFLVGTQRSVQRAAHIHAESCPLSALRQTQIRERNREWDCELILTSSNAVPPVSRRLNLRLAMDMQGREDVRLGRLTVVLSTLYWKHTSERHGAATSRLAPRACPHTMFGAVAKWDEARKNTWGLLHQSANLQAMAPTLIISIARSALNCAQDQPPYRRKSLSQPLAA